MALPEMAAMDAELAAMLAHISQNGAGRSLLSAESADGDLLHVHAHLLALVSQAPAASEASLACVRPAARHTKVQAHLLRLAACKAPLACFA